MEFTENGMNDLISVIVPVYGVEQFLDQCVESIVEQTHKNLEIILVDDGSPDNCPAMCDAWAARDSRIQVIHKVNGGLSDARNAGLSVATGDFLAFVDSDDWIESNMYEVMLKALKEADADFCACGMMDDYIGKSIRHSVEPCVDKADTFLRKIYRDNSFLVSACNKLFKRKCWEYIRFPKGKLCEDAFTCYLLLDNADRVVQIDNAFYHYQIRGESIMTSAFRPARMDEEEAWRCNYEYMKQHHPDIASAAYDFYLQKVHVLIKTIRPDQILQYNSCYMRLFTILSKNAGYVMFRSALPIKYRIRYIIDLIELAKHKGARI